MKPKQRWLILGSLLLATLAAGYLADDEPLPEKGKGKNATERSAVAAGAGENRRLGPSDKLAEATAPLSFPEPAAREEDGEGEAIDPFRTKSWFIAPPPPPPPEPMAPPLPFQFIGKLREDGETRVFLGHQGKNLIAKVGDVINGTYSVEEIAGGQITFLYLPLNKRQSLPIGSDS